MSELNQIFPRQTHYDGATNHYKMAQKGLLSGTPSLIAARELKLLWERSHHACRNNALVASAKIKYRTSLGTINLTWKKKVGSRVKSATDIQSLWDEVMSNPCIDNYGDWTNVFDSWNSSMFESGEAISRQIIKKRKGIKIPLALQHIDPGYLNPANMGNLDKNEKTRNGITFKDGAPSVYNFDKELNGGLILTLSTKETIPVNARDIIHAFIRDRPGQWRGIPVVAPVLMPLYALGDLNDATVSKQQAAQAVSWIIENSSLTNRLAVGTAHVVRDDGSSFSENPVEEADLRIITRATGGEVLYLNEKETAKFSQGEGIGDNYESLVLNETRKIIQAMGLSYQHVMSDLDGISFSALKFIINEIRTRNDFIYYTYLIPLAVNPFKERFLELADTFGFSTKNVYCEYQFPKRYRLDDLKDIQADLLEVVNGFEPLGKKLAERGNTFETIAADILSRKEHGIEPIVAKTKNKTDKKDNN